MQITIEVSGIKDLMLLEDALLLRKNRLIVDDIDLWREEIQRIDLMYHQVKNEIQSQIYEKGTCQTTHQEIG